jgi:hypothetical protein
MHNLQNPRCTACIKCRARQSDRHLKSRIIDHLLWNHGSSLAFVRGTLTDHFFTGQRSIHSTWSASINYVHGGSLSSRYVNEIMHGDAQNGFIDSLKRHARYFIDVISSTPMTRSSSAELFLLLHIASNSSAHCRKKSKLCA